MTRLYIFLLFSIFVQSLRSQTLVSGRVTGEEGALMGAVVKEIDFNHRIVSQTTTDASGLFNMNVRSMNHALSVKKAGYVEHIERLAGRQRLDIQLVKGKSLIDEKLLTGKHRVRETYKLLYGHLGTRNVPQLVRIEMLNDTLFTMILPIQADNLLAAYPAGRILMFVDVTDQPLLLSRNLMEVYTLCGEPEEVDKHSVLARSYIGNDYTPGNGAAPSPMFHYPQFLFTLAEMEALLAREGDICRLLIDTAKGDNFWILYPEETFGKEMHRILTKLRK